jgi:hypothetical protein
MADLRRIRCKHAGEDVACPGFSASCSCATGVWAATEGTACLDCGVEFTSGDVYVEVALTTLTGRRAAVFPQCLGCAAYEQVLAVRALAKARARRHGA